MQRNILSYNCKIKEKISDSLLYLKAEYFQDRRNKVYIQEIPKSEINIRRKLLLFHLIENKYLSFA